MSDSLPACPACAEAYTYEDGVMFVCPSCGHEWAHDLGEPIEASTEREWRDANGTLLADGDTVTVIKDLKVKGASGPVKVGTKVRNIRLVEGDHDIDCKIDGFGQMGLKTQFVRKVG